MENYHLFKLLKMLTKGEGGINTSDATAAAEDIREGKTAYVKDKKVSGLLNFTLFNEYDRCFNKLSDFLKKKLEIAYRAYDPQSHTVNDNYKQIDIILLNRAKLGADSLNYSFTPFNMGDTNLTHEIIQNSNHLVLREATVEDLKTFGLSTQVSDSTAALVVACKDDEKLKFSDIFQFDVYIKDCDGTEIVLPYYFKVSAIL